MSRERRNVQAELSERSSVRSAKNRSIVIRVSSSVSGVSFGRDGRELEVLDVVAWCARGLAGELGRGEESVEIGVLGLLICAATVLAVDDNTLSSPW